MNKKVVILSFSFKSYNTFFRHYLFGPIYTPLCYLKLLRGKKKRVISKNVTLNFLFFFCSRGLKVKKSKPIILQPQLLSRPCHTYPQEGINVRINPLPPISWSKRWRPLAVFEKHVCKLEKYTPKIFANFEIS